MMIMIAQVLFAKQMKRRDKSIKFRRSYLIDHTTENDLIQKLQNNYANPDVSNG